MFVKISIVSYIIGEEKMDKILKLAEKFEKIAQGEPTDEQIHQIIEKITGVKFFEGEYAIKRSKSNGYDFVLVDLARSAWDQAGKQLPSVRDIENGLSRWNDYYEWRVSFI